MGEAAVAADRKHRDFPLIVDRGVEECALRGGVKFKVAWVVERNGAVICDLSNFGQRTDQYGHRPVVGSVG